MRRRSRAGGKPIKTRRRKAATLSRPSAPKVSGRRKPSSTNADTEIALLKRERDEALEQQNASSEILSSISGSITDPRPVFEAIVRNLLRLFGTCFAAVFLVRDGMIEVAGLAGEPGFEKFAERFPVPLDERTHVGKAILSGQTTQITPIVGNPEAPPILQHNARDFGFNSQIQAPMIRDGRVIGTIAIAHRDAVAFTDKQIALVKNFAAQAVIAIENTRLLNELRQRTDDLTESLEQQTATSEVLRVISSSPGQLEPVFQTMLDNAARLCEANFGTLYLQDGENFRVAALHNPSAAFAEERKREPLVRANPKLALGRAINSRQPVQIADLQNEPAYRGDPRGIAHVTLTGHRTALVVPMLNNEAVVGAIAIYRQQVRPFTNKQIALLQNFAAQAVIAIENARLLNELRQRTDDLTESLEQQTATSEVLRVISSSPGELEPVFRTVLANATHLCEANFGVLQLRENGGFRAAAMHNPPPAMAEYRQREPVIRASPQSAIGRVAATKQLVHIVDYAADPAYKQGDPAAVNLVERAGARTVLLVPMLKEGEHVGNLNVYRQEVRPFTDKQIALVQNFAAQAVIAIENTRLLNELRESLQQQTATADVLKVISRSTFDLQIVLNTLVESAAQLCEAETVHLARPRGSTYHFEATFGTTREFDEFVASHPAEINRGTVVGRVLADGTVVHIPDVLTDADYTYVEAQKMVGYRTALGVPLLREGRPVGVIALTRRTVRPFTAKQIELAITFADQAAIAIENTRLLNELRESLQQQTATADVLKIISRSAFDLQTVFETLVKSAAQLCEADAVALHRPMGGTYPWVASLGHSPEYEEYMTDHPIVPDRANILGRALLERRAVQIADPQSDPEFTSSIVPRISGMRTVLGVPLLRESTPIGVIVLNRRTVRPFTDKQIELVTTFADQAVIAIENVRLFEAEQQRTSELSESLEQQTATSEVLKVISSSPGELSRYFRPCWRMQRASVRPISALCSSMPTACFARSRREAFHRSLLILLVSHGSGDRTQPSAKLLAPNRLFISRTCSLTALTLTKTQADWRRLNPAVPARQSWCRCSRRASSLEPSEFSASMFAPSPTNKSRWSQTSPPRP